MKNLEFFKYEGTGNDFILVDQRETRLLDRADTNLIARLCHRRFGIGADGLILLQRHHELDFEMVYFNTDGREGSMCGNGGRCIVAFASRLGLVVGNCRFQAIDGPHEARVLSDGQIALRMSSVAAPTLHDGCAVLNTGSPHFIQPVQALDEVDVHQEGQAIRYSPAFREHGINVNFVERIAEHRLRVATYERGVESETWSCGTGVTAAALALAPGGHAGELQEIIVETRGGQLKVQFRTTASGGFDDIWLIGPASFVFRGSIAIM